MEFLKPEKLTMNAEHFDICKFITLYNMEEKIHFNTFEKGNSNIKNSLIKICI